MNVLMMIKMVFYNGMSHRAHQQQVYSLIVIVDSVVQLIILIE